MVYLILFLSLFNPYPNHVGHVAEYHYTIDGAALHQKFIIDKEELMAFGLSEDCDLKKTTALCALNYLEENSSVKVNGKKLEFELQRSSIENGHLIVRSTAQWGKGVIDEISIRNDCFYEFSSDFKNRIVLNMPGFQHSYLLSKDKNSIHIERE